MRKLLIITVIITCFMQITGCRTVDTSASGYQTQTAAGLPVSASPGVVSTQHPAIIAGVGSRPPAMDERPPEKAGAETEKPIAGDMPDVNRTKNNYAVVQTYFATDRNIKEKKSPRELFGNERSTVSYGSCDVSVPRDHKMGEIESPSLWRLEIRENPAEHVVVLKTSIESKEEFFAGIKTRYCFSTNHAAFLFVHGYNVSFEDAARRTAQIAYDIGFDGIPMFYSWPSHGNSFAYTIDEQNIEWSQTNIKLFLEDFLSRSPAKQVYLIAHSMGNRALTRAVAMLLVEKPCFKDRIKEIILAAPDIDADVFKRDIVPALQATGCPVTLYASSEDLALIASRQIHKYPRAGESGKELVVAPGVETIDATKVDTSFLGHSYFAEARSILADIYYLVREGKRADKRFGLKRVSVLNGNYWEMGQ